MLQCEPRLWLFRGCGENLEIRQSRILMTMNCGFHINHLNLGNLRILTKLTRDYLLTGGTTPLCFAKSALVLSVEQSPIPPFCFFFDPNPNTPLSLLFIFDDLLLTLPWSTLIFMVPFPFVTSQFPFPFPFWKSGVVVPLLVFEVSEELFPLLLPPSTSVLPQLSPSTGANCPNFNPKYCLKSGAS